MELGGREIVYGERVGRMLSTGGGRGGRTVLLGKINKDSTKNSEGEAVTRGSTSLDTSNLYINLLPLNYFSILTMAHCLTC
jgi:hypothetical protein